MRLQVYNSRSLPSDENAYRLAVDNPWHLSDIKDVLRGKEVGLYYVFMIEYRFVNTRKLLCVPICRNQRIGTEFIKDIERKYTSWACKNIIRFGLVMHRDDDGSEYVSESMFGVQVNTLDVLAEPTSDLYHEYFLTTHDSNKESKLSVFLRPPNEMGIEEDVMVFVDSHLPLLKKVCNYTGIAYEEIETPLIFKSNPAAPLYKSDFIGFRYVIRGVPDKFLKTVSVMSRDGFGQEIPIMLRKF